jgi:hypothetical protein
VREEYTILPANNLTMVNNVHFIDVKGKKLNWSVIKALAIFSTDGKLSFIGVADQLTG